MARDAPAAEVCVLRIDKGDVALRLQGAEYCHEGALLRKQELEVLRDLAHSDHQSATCHGLS
eukprot:15053294-Alexandrium_andersonii.AAC.1